jgi:hypothetical protein
LGQVAEVPAVVDVETVPAGDDPAFPLGRPVRFTWTRRGRAARDYEVGAVLTAWATAREWWQDADLPYDAPLDVWHYRVEASSEQGSGVVVLTLDVARARWRLDSFAT